MEYKWQYSILPHELSPDFIRVSFDKRIDGKNYHVGIELPRIPNEAPGRISDIMKAFEKCLRAIDDGVQTPMEKNSLSLFFYRPDERGLHNDI